MQTDTGLVFEQARCAATELLAAAHLRPGDVVVVGCSSSEIAGERIGKGSNLGLAQAVYDAVHPVLAEQGVFLAAQCCEHLNRAIIIETDALPARTPICNVVPQLHAGGAFATVAYQNAARPVAIERIQADAGMDIGDVLIGMQLKPVAVPLRLSVKRIGEAHLVCARTRPKFIGGARAVYDADLA